MRKPLLLLLVCVCMWGAGWAQTRAGFNFTQYGYIPCGTSAPVTYAFTNTSTGANSYLWDFGDGTIVKDSTNPFHTYQSAGTFMVSLTAYGSADTQIISRAIVIAPLSVTYSHQITKGAECSPSNEMHIADAKSPFTDDTLYYQWTVYRDDILEYSTKSTTSSVIYDTIKIPRKVTVDLTVSSKYAISCILADSFILTTSKPIVPTNGEHTLTANRQCIEPHNGWTNYYYDPNTPNDETDDSLVLSLKPNGDDIGTIGDGTFSVSTVATAGAGSNTGILLTNPLISNQSGFWVMNRYWVVTPTHQPTKPVGVRFYFNNQDVADVNGSYPPHNLDVRKLIFYKTHGGNPDPTTNLEGAEYITSLTYDPNIADSTHWRDFDDDFVSSLDKHVAEFQVSSFSGGGGGATGNGQVLPVQLTSFTATNNSNKVSLKWTTAQEINVAKYEVQRSVNGTQFNAIGTVAAHGNASANSYTFSDEPTGASQVYYRLHIIDKDGKESWSSIVMVSFNNNTIALVYPNPAKNSVVIRAKSFENKTITAVVYNAAGLKMTTVKLSFANDQAVLNTSALSSGHYTIVLRDEKSVTHLPLVIVK